MAIEDSAGGPTEGTTALFGQGRLAAPVQMLAAFLFVFLAWEVGTWVLGIPDYLLPAPSVIMAALFVNFPRLLDHAWLTTWEIVVGFVTAIVISIPLAFCLASARILERTVFPVVVFFQIMPKVAIAPLFVIWFGFGLAPKVLIVFLLAFFPMLVSGIAGFKSVPTDIMDLARSTGAGQLRTFLKIRLPSALPSIFTGLKVASALAATAAVVGEFVASDKGLGYLLLEYNGDLNTPMVFAVIIFLSVIGLSIYGMVVAAERYIIPWHVSQRAGPAGTPT